MKKQYVKPELECLLISSVEDILAGTTFEHGTGTEVTDGEWNLGPEDPWK